MNPKKHIRKLSARSTAALLCVLTLAFSVIAQYAVNCSNVRSGVLRLHVIANSDTQTDQSIKLTVRDAVLEAGSEIFDGSVTSEQAIEKITPQLDTLTQTACSVLSENGFEYGAHTYVTEEYFDTRAYGDVTLPAGKYKALKIVLGDGEGENWWCVMFPPLCLPAACAQDDSQYGIFTAEGSAVVKPQNGFEIRFGIVELFEKITAFFCK